MPAWLFPLIGTIAGFGFIFCLAMCRARRGCRYCRIIYFIVGETFGSWLLITGWMTDSEPSFAFGTAILVCLNLWFAIRFLALWLTYKNKQMEKKNTQQKGESESVTLALAATGIAAVAGVGAFTAADTILGFGSDNGVAGEGSGADVGIDVSLDL